GVPGIGEKGALELIKTFGGLDEVYAAVEKEDKRIKAGTLKKLVEGKTKAYLSYKLAHIDQKNNLDFDFEKTILGDYDQAKVLELLHELGIKALDNRLPGVSKKVVAVEEPKSVVKNQKANSLIKSEAQAIVVAYLLD